MGVWSNGLRSQQEQPLPKPKVIEGECSRLDKAGDASPPDAAGAGRGDRSSLNDPMEALREIASKTPRR